MQDVVRVHDGALLGPARDGALAACGDVDGPGGRHVGQERTRRLHLHAASKKRKQQERTQTQRPFDRCQVAGSLGVWVKVGGRD